MFCPINLSMIKQPTLTIIDSDIRVSVKQDVESDLGPSYLQGSSADDKRRR